MGEVLLLAMETAMAGQQPRLEALKSAHRVHVVAPRWPDCQPAIRDTRPSVVLVDGSHAPSHGRAVAKWLTTQGPFRSLPVVFLDVPDRDAARVKREIPRAQFATWAGVIGAVDRLVRESDRPGSS